MQTKPNKTNKKVLFVWLFGGIIGLSVLMFASWVIIEGSMEATSGAEFCGLCHTMTPMVKANAQSLHGGNTPYGAVAKCNDCHTTHDNLIMCYLP